MFDVCSGGTVPLRQTGLEGHNIMTYDSWKAKNLEVKKGAAERLEHIIERLADSVPGRINGMMAPRFICCDEERRITEIGFDGYEWEMNARYEIHGGIIAAMFDTAMGFTVAAWDDATGVSTADMQISYIKPFRSSSFIFNTELVYMGNRNIRVRGTAFDEDKRNTLAICNATFARVFKAW